jgi:carbon monoxide dehydrogenase subunit G
VAVFSRTRQDTAEIPHPVEDVWALLVDPGAVARLTPMVSRIDARGDDVWVWCLQGVPLSGKVVDLTMTEQMSFEPQTRIDFTHEPLESGIVAGAQGFYELEPSDAGTRLTIDLTVSARLPLPGLARPAVQTAMAQVLRHMGTRFASNMLRELGGAADRR